MTTAIALGGFFVMVAAALQFSSWAEGWLASGASPIKKRASAAEASPSREPSVSAREYETVRAATARHHGWKLDMPDAKVKQDSEAKASARSTDSRRNLGRPGVEAGSQSETEVPKPM